MRCLVTRLRDTLHLRAYFSLVSKAPNEYGDWPVGDFPDAVPGSEADVARRLGEFVWVVLAYRNGARVSQRDLADRAGISRDALQKFEKGHRWPDAHLMLKLLSVLDADSTPVSYRRSS